MPKAVSTVTKSQAAAACERKNTVHETVDRVGDGLMCAAFRIFPDGRRRYGMAETREFASDATVSPCRVLFGHLLDELSDLRCR